MSKQYGVNEIFYSLQGEGRRSGDPSFFLRFRHCNLVCSVNNEAGFDCDTEWVSGKAMTLGEINSAMLDQMPSKNTLCKWIVLTGGEPALQVDEELIKFFHDIGYKLAIETNGTIELPPGIDHITVSPKSAEHTIRQLTATEVKYVRKVGQGIPVPVCEAEFKYISPAFDVHGLSRENLQHCIELCRNHPDWSLSVQQHKQWVVR